MCLDYWTLNNLNQMKFRGFINHKLTCKYKLLLIFQIIQRGQKIPILFLIVIELYVGLLYQTALDFGQRKGNVLHRVYPLRVFSKTVL
jgi:hypothetical protein